MNRWLQKWFSPPLFRRRVKHGTSWVSIRSTFGFPQIYFDQRRGYWNSRVYYFHENHFFFPRILMGGGGEELGSHGSRRRCTSRHALSIRKTRYRYRLFRLDSHHPFVDLNGSSLTLVSTRNTWPQSDLLKVSFTLSDIGLNNRDLLEKRYRSTLTIWV